MHLLWQEGRSRGEGREDELPQLWRRHNLALREVPSLRPYLQVSRLRIPRPIKNRILATAVLLH